MNQHVSPHAPAKYRNHDHKTRQTEIAFGQELQAIASNAGARSPERLHPGGMAQTISHKASVSLITEREVMPVASGLGPTENDHRKSGHESRPLVRLGATPLDDIAALIRSLTYGEMLELAKGLAEGGEITETTLPAVLHEWSRRSGI